ncbi:MAG: metal ABC transporter permease [Propionibacteriaceae bacterium]|jgi:zinc transport system permease protein|nr:metal ABC transporter permease [Propionibacteriaceae bacterium]
MPDILDVLAYPFMQRALIAAVLSGLLAPAVGMYVVQRRLSLLGDGLGHVAIAGVGLALVTGWTPFPVAVAVCVLGAVAIEALRGTGKAPGDTGLAILFYGGLALGILLAGVANRGTAALSQYLFGSLTTVSGSDVLVLAVLCVTGVALTLLLAPQLFSVCADEEYARTQGLPVRALNMLIVALAAITVSASMRTVGVLLVSALMVVPVAAASNIATGFRATLLTALGIGVAVAAFGTLGSVALDTPSGATIVVLAVAVFVLTAALGGAIRHRHRPPAEEPELPTFTPHIPAEADATHPPETLEGMPGTTAVLHGDHVDYLLHGHRHAPHGDHWDEH